MRAIKESNDFISVKSLADYYICEQFVIDYSDIIFYNYIYINQF
jgi:hypothetical protein